MAGPRIRLGLAALIWAASTAVIGTGLMLAGNAATEVDGQWPAGLET